MRYRKWPAALLIDGMHVLCYGAWVAILKWRTHAAYTVPSWWQTLTVISNAVFYFLAPAVFMLICLFTHREMDTMKKDEVQKFALLHIVITIVLEILLEYYTAGNAFFATPFLASYTASGVAFWIYEAASRPPIRSW